MGGEYYSDPIVVKKYIKIPDRRLISGLLSVNVISHSGNDTAGDDAFQYYFDNYAAQTSSLKRSTPFYNDGAVNFADPERDGYKHTFGDYDCFLFWVAGGMTLQAPIFSTSLNQAALASANYVHSASGSTTWEDDTGSPNDTYTSEENWYSTLTHPCQHFLKSHLIGRINNGAGWTDTDVMKINPILTHAYEINDQNDASMASDNATATPTNAFTARKGKWSRHIISNGVYCSDSDGDFIEDLSTDANNTYFPTVENVEVYGKHNFNVPVHTSDDTGAGSPGTIYSNDTTTVGNYSHEDDFWSMVIKISMRGYNHEHSDGAGNSETQATTEFFRSRTNVFFQPFGETASFDISDTFHTS
tara:strand:+ start:823 stop:1899 length:1077 start_codon:yes stop_codon:yes gene_type:complete